MWAPPALADGAGTADLASGADFAGPARTRGVQSEISRWRRSAASGRVKHRRGAFESETLRASRQQRRVLRGAQSRGMPASASSPIVGTKMGNVITAAHTVEVEDAPRVICCAATYPDSRTALSQWATPSCSPSWSHCVALISMDSTARVK